MSASEASQVLLAQKWDESIDPTGYWMSEKLDGIRAYFDGKHFYSRSGNRFNAPEWFTEEFPKMALDGELWAGRGLFQKTTSIVKKTKNPVEQEWKDLKFIVFDAPKVKGTFEQRMEHLKTNVPSDATHVAVLAAKKCKGLKHMKEMLKEVLDAGGEGLMLRQAGSFYERGRSDTLLKVKIFHDEEAQVVGYRKGNTNPKHRHLECQLPNGVQFWLGNGFTEYEHTHPPPIGSVVTFQYQEVTNNGIPRFPSFVRVREDVTWEEVVSSYNDDTKARHSKRSPTDCNKDPILFSTIKAINVEELLNIGSPSKKSPSPNKGNKNFTAANKGNGSAKTASQGNAGLVPCKYGASCYQKNPQHLKQYSHPHINNNNVNNDENENNDKADSDRSHEELSDRENNDADLANDANDEGDNNKDINNNEDEDEEMAEATLPVCAYGANCYRKNPDHFKQFSHPPKPGTAPVLPKKEIPKKPLQQDLKSKPTLKNTIRATDEDSDDEFDSNNNTSAVENKNQVQQKKIPVADPKPKPKPTAVLDEKNKTTPASSNNTKSTIGSVPKSSNGNTGSVPKTSNSNSGSAAGTNGAKRRTLPDWAQTKLTDYQKTLQSSTDGDT